MKIGKFSKVALLALSLILLAGTVLGISALAEGESTHKAEILFKNLEYDDTIGILYAAQLDGKAEAGAALSLDFYEKNDAGEYVKSYSVTNYKIDTIKVRGEDHSVYIFESIGLAPKYMTKVLYAQLVATVDGVEYKSDMTSYSIAEYCYKRLYKDGNANADQTKLYKDVLKFGKSVQLVLNHETDRTPDKFSYLSIDGGVAYSQVIAGESYDFDSGIFLNAENKQLILPASETAIPDGYHFEWMVSTAGGAFEKASVGTQIALTDHTVIRSSIRKTVVDFEDGSVGNIILPENNENFTSGLVSDPAGSSDKVLHLQNINNSAVDPSTVKVPVDVLDENGNCYILSFDFYYDGRGEFSHTASSSSFGGTPLSLRFMYNNDIVSRLSASYRNDSSGTAMYFSSSNGKGVTVERPGDDKYTAYDYLTSLLANKKWFNVRMELYKQSDNTYKNRIFFNDVYIAEDYSWTNTRAELTSFDIVTTVSSSKAIEFSTYYNNVSFVKTNREYAELDDNFAGTASGTGEYFADGNKTGFRVDFTTTTTAENGINDINNMSPIANESDRPGIGFYRVNYDDDYLLAVKEDYKAGHRNFRYFTQQKPAASTDSMVIEMDMAFSDLGVGDSINNGTHFMVISGSSNGMRSDIYLTVDPEGKIRFGQNIDRLGGDTPALDQNKWYNIRFVFNKDNNILVFVDGTYFGIFEGADAGKYTYEDGRINMYLHSSAAIGSKVAYDNLYVGYEAAKTGNENAVWGSGINLAVVTPSASRFDVFGIVNAVTASTGTAAYQLSDAKTVAETDHELVIGNTSRQISANAYAALEPLLTTGKGGWLLYAEGNSLAAVYTSETARARMFKYIEENLVSINELIYAVSGDVKNVIYDLAEVAEEERVSARDEAFAEIMSYYIEFFGGDSVATEKAEAIVAALQELYTLYDADVYKWLAGLYDPEIGGFYYSNSGRYTEGFLPDLESTYQALTHLNGAGMFGDVGGYKYAISEEMKTAIIGFAKSLQQPDGYFYHPQWTTYDTAGNPILNGAVASDYFDARRGRDFGWGKALLRDLGATPNYAYPGQSTESASVVAPASALTMRLSASSVTAVSKVTAANSTLPTYLQSLENWEAYLNNLNIENDPYMAGNTLAAIHNDIAAAGDTYIDFLVNYLNGIRNSETGFWGEGVTYITMNGFMKLSHSYTYYGREMDYLEEALDSTVTMLLTPDTEAHDLHICNTYNTWVNFTQIIGIAEKSNPALAETLRNKLIARAPELISITYDKISTHARDDGGFSYNEKRPSTTSQAAPTAPEGGAIEGDVNATCISVTGIASNIFLALGIDQIPIYTPADADVFLELIENSEPFVKNTSN